MNSCLHVEHEQQAPTCHMKASYNVVDIDRRRVAPRLSLSGSSQNKPSYLCRVSRVVCLVIRLVDIDRNRVAPLACHLAARVKTSHERLFTRSRA